MELKDMICGNFYRITQRFGLDKPVVWIVRFEKLEGPDYLHINKGYCISVTSRQHFPGASSWGRVDKADTVEMAAWEEIEHLLACVKMGSYVDKMVPKKEDYPIW